MPKLTRYAVLLSLAVTVFSVFVSVAFTSLWFELDTDVTRTDVLTVATVIPLFCGPICTLYGVRGRQRIQELASENERLAYTDMLTGLPNRRAFFTQIATPVMTAPGALQSVAFIVCDIDNFKAFNDEYGHNVGDQVLVHIANLIKTALPESATVARLGGEEFVVFCSDTAAVDVDAVAANLVETVAATPLSFEGHLFNVTMSVGVSVSMASGDPARAIRDADRAMYEAKSKGRNQFVRAA